MTGPSKLPLGRVRDAALTRFEYARRAGRSCGERRVVAIVGMHRSGTSAVAGALEEAGLYLGNVLRTHESNRKGTRENLRIVELHDEILAFSGGSWREPPARMMWTHEHRERRDRIVASFAAAYVWGFKDPRTVLLLDFWRETLGESLKLVGVFRDPTAVVSSLRARDGGATDEWFGLWMRYNETLLREHAGSPFPLVEFVREAGLFHGQLAPVIRNLGLHQSRRRRFFETRLVSPKGPHAVHGTSDVAALYEHLRAIQREPTPLIPRSP
jgi:hypothetical protein